MSHDEPIALGRASSALTDAAAIHPAISLSSLSGLQGAFGRADTMTRVYGKQMATGPTAQAAARAFHDDYTEASGLSPGELPPDPDSAPLPIMVDPETGDAKFTLFRYTQRRAGIPVYGGRLKVLVKNADNSVVWAGSSLRDLGDFRVSTSLAPAGVDGDKSRAAVRGRTRGRRAPTRFSLPDLVIYAGIGDAAVEPRLAMTYESLDPGAPWAFVADAETGDVLQAEETAHSFVSGNVRGNVIAPGGSRDCAPVESQPVPYVGVSSTTGGNTSTGPLGNFWIFNHGNPAQLSTGLNGLYFDIQDEQSPVEILNQSVNPPGPASFFHNASDVDAARSQVSAYVALNEVRDAVLSYVPDFPGVSTQTNFPALVNAVDEPACTGGGAWSMGDRIIFCEEHASNQLSNTAFATVAYHEYGHELIQEGAGTPTGSQAEYGEGMSDAVAVLVSGAPELGVGFDMAEGCQPFRSADNVCVLDPGWCAGGAPECGGGLHNCGQVLSGAVWETRNALQLTEPGSFHDIISALTYSSIPLHTSWTIDQTILIDFLTLDDDDGDLTNGTPHSDEICEGFEAKGFECPELDEPSTPCDSVCSSPMNVTWSGNFQSGPLGTGSVCLETTQAVSGGNCGNLAPGRQLFVNGTPMVCNGGNWSSLPAPVAGGYCITTTPGNYSWAFLTLW